MFFLCSFLVQMQMGIGHDFHSHSTGWKWKVTSAIGSSGLPEVHQKTTLPIFPGVDIAVGWTAHYEPPEVHGYVIFSLTPVKLVQTEHLLGLHG
jgi:hypothetical protein